jgi:hypothetical protein
VCGKKRREARDERREPEKQKNRTRAFSLLSSLLFSLSQERAVEEKKNEIITGGE